MEVTPTTDWSIFLNVNAVERPARGVAGSCYPVLVVDAPTDCDCLMLPSSKPLARRDWDGGCPEGHAVCWGDHILHWAKGRLRPETCRSSSPDTPIAGTAAMGIIGHFRTYTGDQRRETMQQSLRSRLAICTTENGQHLKTSDDIQRFKHQYAMKLRYGDLRVNCPPDAFLKCQVVQSIG